MSKRPYSAIISTGEDDVLTINDGSSDSESTSKVNNISTEAIHHIKDWFAERGISPALPASNICTVPPSSSPTSELILPTATSNSPSISSKMSRTATSLEKIASVPDEISCNPISRQWTQPSSAQQIQQSNVPSQVNKPPPPIQRIEVNKPPPPIQRIEVNKAPSTPQKICTSPTLCLDLLKKTIATTMYSKNRTSILVKTPSFLNEMMKAVKVQSLNDACSIHSENLCFDGKFIMNRGIHSENLCFDGNFIMDRGIIYGIGKCTGKYGLIEMNSTEISIMGKAMYIAGSTTYNKLPIKIINENYIIYNMKNIECHLSIENGILLRANATGFKLILNTAPDDNSIPDVICPLINFKVKPLFGQIFIATKDKQMPFSLEIYSEHTLAYGNGGGYKITTTQFWRVLDHSEKFTSLDELIALWK